MRESLTIAAILLIVVLTTALVGPYFVDWNAHRGEVEARLSELLGAKVTVSGPIDVKLLPRPIFKLQRVQITGAAPRDGAVSAERVDVELALTAMLRGEIRFIDAEITRPRITLTTLEDGSLVLPSLGDTDPARVSVGHIAIHDGALAFEGANGRNLTLTGLEGDGEAESLAGPFKFAGHFDTPRGPLVVHVATGGYAAGKFALKATLDPLAGLPKVDAEGMVALARAARGGSAFTFEGSVVADGAVPLPGAHAVIPWRIGSRVHLDAGQAVASDLELRAGADNRALVATGEAQWGLDPGVAAHVALRARQIDVAKLAVPPDAAGADTAGAAPDSSNAGPAPAITHYLAALKAFAQDADAFAALPIPLALDYGADTLTLGAETLTGLEGAVMLAAGKPVIGSLAVDAGDGTHVKLDGSFEPGSAAVFKGRAEVASRDLGRFEDGIRADLPDAADWLRHTIPAKSLAFKGAVDLSGVGFAAHEVSLALDRSSFAGTLTLTRAVGTERARLFADLTSEALDIDALPDWRGAAEAASNLDLSFTLTARAVRLARTDLGTVDAGRIGLQLHKEGSAITLDRLSLADLGGATAELTGRSDGSAAHLTGRFDIRKLLDLATLMQRTAPNPITNFLLARAEVLSPALLRIAADAAVNDDGTLTPTAITLDGTAAGTAVALHLKPEPVPASRSDDPLTRFRSGRAPFTVTLSLDAPESGALLRQIGLTTLPSTALGHGRIEASARLSGPDTLDGAASATLGDSVIGFKGHGSMAADLNGRLTLQGPNVAPLLRAVMLATPESGATWPVDAAAEVTLRGRKIGIQGLEGHLIGARFGGELTYVPPSPDLAVAVARLPATAQEPAALTGSLTLDRLPLPVLAGLALGPLAPPKPGAVWPDAPFAPAFLTLPRSEVAITAGAVPLYGAYVAHDARLTLRLAPGVVTVADLAATLADGRIGGSLTLRRDAAAASLSGHVDWSGLPLASPSLGGRSTGAMDLAATGTSLSGLVASLAGSGTLDIKDARLPRFDPDAIIRVVTSSDAAPASIDPLETAQAVGRELDRGALALGDVTTPLAVAAGVLRSDPVKSEGPAITAATQASLDLKTLTLALRATATARALPKDWSGDPPQVSILWTGAFAAPARQVDAASLINGIAARAIAREQARIDAFQEDVRERAFFSRRLKAIEAEQAAKAEADRQKAAPAPHPDAAPPKPSPKPEAPPAAASPPAPKPPETASRPEGVRQSAAPTPIPVSRPSSRPGKDQKPLELQRKQKGFDLPAPPPVPAIPDLSGRY